MIGGFMLPNDVRTILQKKLKDVAENLRRQKRDTEWPYCDTSAERALTKMYNNVIDAVAEALDVEAEKA